MTARSRVVLALVVLLLGVAGHASAQQSSRELARELARVLLQSTERQAIDDQVVGGLVQSMAVMLQNRLSRRLLEVEWQTLVVIARRFVNETLTPSRTEEIAAEVYLRHFDGAELAELLRFQRSAVGQKASRLGPVLGAESAQAIDREIRESPALPTLADELRREFPVLGAPQSP